MLVLVSDSKPKAYIIKKGDFIMGLFKDYVNMTRKPEGFLGKIMIKGMNSGHAKMPSAKKGQRRIVQAAL